MKYNGAVFNSLN